MSYRLSYMSFIWLMGLHLVAAAESKYGPGASETEIKIGNTAPYSGAASPYGTIGLVQAAYFKMINERGGVNGRKINFITRDDAYSPAKTVEQVRKLVESDEVLALVGNVGTSPNLAIQKYINVKKVPQIFNGSASSAFADPIKSPWTMGWPPLALTEGYLNGRYVVENVTDPKVAILTQGDDAAKDFMTGFKLGLGKNADSIIVAKAIYQQSDPTVDSQVVSLASSGANVFYNTGTSKFVAQAIRKAHELGWKPVQLLISVGNSVRGVLEPAGLENSVGLVTAQFLKDPTDPRWADDPAIVKWLEFMNKYYPTGSKEDVLNVYGYALAESFVHVLQQAGDDLSRENLMRQAANLKDVEISVLLPGIRLNTSPTDFSPIKQMQFARFNGKAWESFGDLMTRPAPRE